jgi:hypothetical protein
MAINHQACVQQKVKALTTVERDMALGDLQHDWTSSRRFVRTRLATKMKITLLGSTMTHEARGLRKAIIISVKI